MVSRPRPETHSTHFPASTRKPFDRLLGVLLRGLSNFPTDAQPVANHDHIAERHSRLYHAVGTWIHTHKQSPFGCTSIQLQISRMRPRSIYQRVINASNWIRKRNLLHSTCEFLGNRYEVHITRPQQTKHSRTTQYRQKDPGHGHKKGYSPESPVLA